MKIFSVRMTNLFCLILCTGLLGFAGYLQFYHGLISCPLCIIQRVIFLLLTVLFLIGALQRSETFGTRYYQYFICFVATLGAGVAGRQVWLQSFSDPQIPACGPSFTHLFNTLPSWGALRQMFQGSTDCAEVQWHFLNLSIPEWAFLFFLGFAALTLLNALRSK